ncbi:RecQ family zinc-binding domain-containing protein, partial [bacterium]|nr:RecQ family zinc-binding domain-containing protein [bacterium]
MNQLRLKEAAKVITGFDRPNLLFEVKYTRNDIEKYREIQRLMSTLKGMGIIYVGTKHRAEEMASVIQETLKIPSAFYHAGMERNERIYIQEKFMTEGIRVVAATNAFGMGIDKPNIRYIIHFEMPGTVEAYYQEAGRAGRDGKEARCILLYSPNDMTLQKYFIEEGTPSKGEIIAIYDYIREAFRGKKEEIIDSRKIELATGLNDTKVKVGISTLEQIGALKRTPDCSYRIEIKPLVPKAELWSEIKHQGPLTQKIFHIIREKKRINIPELAQQLNHTYDRIEDAFLGLYCKGLIAYRSYERGMTIRLSAPRLEGRYLKLDAAELRRHKNWRYKQLQAIVNYGESALCRRYYIRSYFGEKDIPQNCSACDNCLASRGKVKPGIEAGEEEISPTGINYFLQILECLKEIGWGVGRQILVQILAGSKARKIHSYQRLKHYACLKGMNQKKLLRQIESLIKNGFLRTEIGEYPVLVLTSKSREILKDNISREDKPIIAQFNREIEKLLPEYQEKEYKEGGELF